MNRKKKLIIGIIALMVVIIIGLIVILFIRKQSAQSEITLVAQKGQSIQTMEITEIIGNEMSAADSTSGETVNYEIPVGTRVITKLGTDTTFSKLHAGDTIEVLMEDATKNILAIRITE